MPKSSDLLKVHGLPRRQNLRIAVADAEKGTFMENEPSSFEQAFLAEQAAAKAAILAECDRLSEAGFTFVAVHFDGSGDEGASEDIKCYAAEDYAYEGSEVGEINFSHLQEHFETLVPYGYEN